MRAFRRSSTSKHSGALMSSRLMPPKVGSSAATTSTSLSTFVLVDLDVEDVDAGELLEQDRLALHHGLGGERADIAEAEHGGAVGDHRDEVLARGEVRGLRRIGRDRLARRRRRRANRRAPGRAGCRAAWSAGSPAFRGADSGGRTARPISDPPRCCLPSPTLLALTVMFSEALVRALPRCRQRSSREGGRDREPPAPAEELAQPAQPDPTSPRRAGANATASTSASSPMAGPRCGSRNRAGSSPSGAIAPSPTRSRSCSAGTIASIGAPPIRSRPCRELWPTAPATEDYHTLPRAT